MGSKHFLDSENDMSRMNYKRFKNSIEETTSKKTMSVGRTLAQKRLEKIKQQLKDTAKAKEVTSPINKGRNLNSSDETLQSASMTKKEYSAINKGKKRRGKTLAQGRLEKYQNDIKKDELHVISSQSKKVDKKNKKESISSAIKSFTNKISDSSDLLIYNKTTSSQSNADKCNEISKSKYTSPLCQPNVAKSNLTNKNNNVTSPRCQSSGAKHNEIDTRPICKTDVANISNKNNFKSKICPSSEAKHNEISRTNYIRPACLTNIPKSNTAIKNNFTSQICPSSEAKHNEMNKTNYTRLTSQTNVAKSNTSNKNNFTLPRCQSNTEIERTNFTPSINQANITKIQDTIRNKIIRSKRNVSSTKIVKETSPKIDNSIVKNKNLLANLYKRKPVEDTVNNTILEYKKIPIEPTEKKKKKLNTIKKAIVQLNEINSTRKFDQTQVSNEDNIKVTDDFVEDMEWEPICEDITLELKTVRNAVINDEFIEMMDWQESVLEIDKVPDSNVIHYVIDSNIFISSLEIVKKIKEKDAESIIVIPWQVLKELDSLKRGPPLYTDHVAASARSAIQYLLSCQTEHTSNVVWQTQKQANQPCPDFSVEIADDHIIKCCFQLNCSGHNVVLLSNDKNLRLKASVHKIATISDEKLLEKMAFKINKSEKLPLEEQPTGTTELEIYAHKFTEVFKTFLNNIIQQYLKSIYGNMWLWYIPEKPPLSLMVLLELIKNFSNNIFTSNECQKYINQINTFFKKQTYAKLTINEFDSIIRICLKLAKLLPQDKDYLEKAVQFEDNLAFLKAREPTESVSYNDLCCKLTVQHFNNFEGLLVGYCLKVAEVLKINFADSILSKRRYILPEKFDIKLIPHYINVLKVISSNLERISKIPPQQIFVHTKAIIPLYNTLITCVEDCDTFFTIEDVVEFCKHGCIRSNLPEALRIFHCMIEFLGTAKNIALSKKLIVT